MPPARNDYADHPTSYSEVIAKAIEDWKKHQTNALTLPLDERALGSLDLLIKHRLVRAGIMDREPKAAEEM